LLLSFERLIEPLCNSSLVRPLEVRQRLKSIPDRGLRGSWCLLLHWRIGHLRLSFSLWGFLLGGVVLGDFVQNFFVRHG
jgi:hypothetical protein